MSNVLTPTAEPTLGITPPRMRWTFPPLFMKELRASRTLLIAGLWTYFLMPALLDVAYMVFFERGLRTSMIVWIMMIGLGWFYVIIVGAQVVCRDWGQGEEKFLRAQPISTSSIVWAKWWAGLITLFSIAMLNMAWTIVLSMRDPEPMRVGQTDIVFLAVFFAVLLVGYSIAFATAFLTRQTLTSILAAVLAMVGWWVAPWLSRHLDFLYPKILQHTIHYRGSYRDSSELIGVAFGCGVVFVIVTGFFVAIRVAHRESSPRIGAKPMAWTIAGCVLLVFTLAMNEVGSSLTVRDQHLLPPEYMFSHREPKSVTGGRFTSSKNVGFILAPRYWEHMPAARIRLTAKGKIDEILIEDLWPMMNMSGRSVALAIPEWSATGPDDLKATIATSEGTQLGLIRCRLHWTAAGKPSLVSIQKQALPVDAPRDFQFIRSAATDIYGYLLVRIGDSSQYLLYVYDWSAGSNSPPAYTIPIDVYNSPSGAGVPTEHSIHLPGEFLDMIQLHGKLALSTNRPNHLNSVATLIVDESQPGQLIQIPQKELMVLPSSLWWSLVQSAQYGFGPGNIYDESGIYYWASVMAYDPTRHMAYFSSQEVFGGCDENQKLQGVYRFNLLAGMFRSWQARLQVIPGQRVMEVGETILTVFDVSDGKDPRRIGFFNMGSPGQADVYAVGEHLILLEGRRLSVLGLPK